MLHDTIHILHKVPNQYKVLAFALWDRMSGMSLLMTLMMRRPGPVPRQTLLLLQIHQIPDFLEAYLSYKGSQESILNGTTIKLGRQIITYRKAPFHRFMGTVLWCQNWQNHDAFTLQNKSLANTTINYAYSWNVNRIFTDKAVGGKGEFDSDSHFVNVKYDGFKYAKLEGYAYLLDFDNSPVNSTETFGGRISGSYPTSKNMKIIYAGEYASQDDYGSAIVELDEDYYLGEIGVKFMLGNVISSVMLKFDYEVLTGNGTNAFLTPLATGHAFQGWADRFLFTPADGIEDAYFTAVVMAYGAKFIASYHMIESDNLGYDYGDELDLLLTKTFKDHYTFGAKIAIYDADTNATNVARGGIRAADVTKTWFWAQIKF
ncbi:MAG: hypothetical protein QGM50_09450 [Anaerolineae bacterium]|nr:hypothetical protein [Anaerolineae bacterium]